MNNPLQVLYELQNDIDSFWIVYDLCLENNFCELSQLPVNWHMVGSGSKSYKHFSTHTENYTSYCRHVNFSSSGFFMRSHAHDRVFSTDYLQIMPEIL
jgi:hypothetical protein